MDEGQKKFGVEGGEAGAKEAEDSTGFDGWRSGLRQKLVSACREKLYSFADLPMVLRDMVDTISDGVKHRRRNLHDAFLAVPFMRSESSRAKFAELFESGGFCGHGIGGEERSSNWQRNPRYRKTSLLENMAKIIEENLDKKPDELCRMLFDCEERFYNEDRNCTDGVLVDYRGFLKEIGFFKLLRDAVTVEYLDDEPTAVLALVSLFGSKALDVIGVVK